MVDYSKSKIYKLQCDDGHYYIGSTRNELRKRFQDHKRKSTESPDRLVYQHIKEIGWDKVRIVLIEEVSCETKYQLIQHEDRHIQQNINNPLCLNTNHAVFNLENAKERKKEYIRENRESVTIRQALYRDRHRDHINEQRRIRYAKKQQANNLSCNESNERDRLD